MVKVLYHINKLSRILVNSNNFNKILKMTDLTSLGYPQGYHLGLSAVLWWITIVVLLILAIILYLNARKSDLINVKEMFLSKSFLYICYTIQFSLIQVGALYSENFVLFFLIGTPLSMTSMTIYFYFWEKNLTSMKHIPTILTGTASIINIAGLITYILFPDLIIFLIDILSFIIIFLMMLAFLFYIYLIFVFSKHVKGVRTRVAVIWIVGVIIGYIYLFLEYPPGVNVAPSFLVFYITPILSMISSSMMVYGTITLFAQISSYYAQTQKCAVHRGVIEKGNTVYYCPSCGIVYCDTCFNQVIKKDGCWNCRHGVEVEIEKEWKAEQVIEVKKDAKPKPKHTN